MKKQSLILLFSFGFLLVAHGSLVFYFTNKMPEPTVYGPFLPPPIPPKERQAMTTAASARAILLCRKHHMNHTEPLNSKGELISVQCLGAEPGKWCDP